MNSLPENTSSRGDFVLKNQFETLVLKISVKNESDSDLVKRLKKFPLLTTRIFNLRLL